MIRYGSVLDSGDPRKQGIYSLFVEYLGNPLMSKTKHGDSGSVNMCRVRCLVRDKDRFIAVVSQPDRNPLGAEFRLSEIDWISLQTRSFNDPETARSVPSHCYQPRRLQGLDDSIEVVQRNPDGVHYKCDKLPLKIVLIPRKDDDMYGFVSNGSILNAIETYSTIIVFDNEKL